MDPSIPIGKYLYIFEASVSVYIGIGKVGIGISASVLNILHQYRW